MKLFQRSPKKLHGFACNQPTPPVGRVNRPHWHCTVAGGVRPRNAGPP